MAKNVAANGHRKRSGSGNVGGGRKPRSSKSGRRVILFPTEPSTIGNDKIEWAVREVMSRKK